MSVHPLRKLHEAFDAAEPYVGWFLLLAGVGGLIGTAAGWEPPVWVVGVIGWLLVAREGNKAVGEWLQDEVEAEDDDDWVSVHDGPNTWRIPRGIVAAMWFERLTEARIDWERMHQHLERHEQVRKGWQPTEPAKPHPPPKPDHDAGH